MSMTIHEAGSGRSDINVAPLVDVVLVLLIIFMVITPLVQTGHEVRVPPSTSGPGGLDGRLIVRLTCDGSVFLNAERVTRSEFPARLHDVLATRRRDVTLVAASGELAYEQVARFLEECRSAGAGEIGLVLEELTGG
ncbi:MAG: biopolymer transporter ExbD [Acidobacteria bacterium]|nr:biopolymer transporter ExbD [Acidobacteriota bacterium]